MQILLTGTHHDICACLFFRILFGVFCFQNHFKMHSFLLWILAQKFKVYYRIFFELSKEDSLYSAPQRLVGAISSLKMTMYTTNTMFTWVVWKIHCQPCAFISFPL